MPKLQEKKPKPETNAYFRPGGALRDAWARLHEGDCEPYPDAATLQAQIHAAPALAPGGSVDAAASALQSAWRAYHAGAFTDAVAEGTALGLLGTNVANKAANIEATYLITDEAKKLAAFQASAARAERLQAAAPKLVNGWYFHAQALGRYSQGISVAKALAEGLAGQVRRSLEQTLVLAPLHAEAHIAFGTYHAEIVAKVGALMAGLTYGAKRDTALTHFETALKLLPHSAIARTEYANALAMVFGRSRLADARRLYQEAAGCIPEDAMEGLDVAAARAEIEE
jgi:tetratricopeptide (TPR) repeat protein